MDLLTNMFRMFLLVALLTKGPLKLLLLSSLWSFDISFWASGATVPGQICRLTTILEFCWKGHPFLSQHQQQMTNKPIQLQKKQMQTMKTLRFPQSKLLLGDSWRCLNKSSKPPQDLSSKGTSRHIPRGNFLQPPAFLTCNAFSVKQRTLAAGRRSYEGWNLMISLLLPSGNFT